MRAVEKIRVLVADDHPIVRQGILSLLSSYEDMEVVGEADTGGAVLERVEDLGPDVVLLDIRMPGPDGLEVARRLRRDYPQTKVLVLTTYDDDEYVYGALHAGCHGYLLKSVSHEVLASSIRAVYRGEYLLSPPLVGKVVKRFEELASEKAQQKAGLTGLELEVLRLIADGATTRDIAEKMYWSEITVKRKIRDILGKLGATNRTQAVAQAIRHGLI